MANAENWQGSFEIGPGWAVFVGTPGESAEHAHHAIQICLAGDVPIELRIDEGVHQILDIAVIPSGRRHSIRWRGGFGALVYLEPDSAPGRQVVLASGYAGARLESVDRIRRIIRNLSGASSNVRGDELRRIRDEAFAAWLVPLSSAATSGDPRIDRICTEVRRRIGDTSIRVCDLAAEIGLSPNRLAELMREHAGITLRRLILWTRLERAVSMVASGHSLTEVAARAGFSDSAHLARTFRRMFGTSLSRGLTPLHARRVNQ